MLQAVVVHVQHLHDEFHAFQLGDFENVNRDDLLNKVSALIGWDLEGIDPQAEKHLRQAFLWLCLLIDGTQQLVLMVPEYLLRYE